MVQIILTDDQSSALRFATGAVEVRDRQGTLVGYLSRPPSEAEVAIAAGRLASDGPWLSTQEVLDHLDSLESR